MRLGSGSTAPSRFIGSVAAGAALALTLVACPGGSGGPGSSASPARGGEIVVAYPYEPTTLNPFVFGGDAPPTRDLARPFMPELFRIGPKGERVPSLLAAEPSGADLGGSPFGVRLRLRNDAVWSDGVPITAADLRFTWQAVMRSPGIASRDGYDRIADVVVEAPKIARLVFHEPFARWRDLFSAGLGVLPQHSLVRTDISKALVRSWPVSGGPFVLKSWTPGLEMVLDRNPHPWGAVPLVDRIRIQFVPDPVTALALFARHRVDVLGPYFAADLARRARASIANALVTTDRGATWVGLFLNVKSSPLDDVRVRRALAFAIDRAAIVEGLVRQEGEVLDAPSGGDAARTAPSFAQYAYAPSHADALLRAAGWRPAGSSRARHKAGNELSFTVAAVSDDELAQRVLRAMNAEANGVGIDLNLTALDSTDLWGSWIASSRFQAALLVERDPPGGALRARFGIAGENNISGVADASLREMLDASDRRLDDASPAVEAPFGRIASLVPVVPLFRLDVVVAARPSLHEIAADASADGFLWNCERWWVEGGASPSPTAS